MRASILSVGCEKLKEIELFVGRSVWEIASVLARKKKMIASSFTIMENDSGRSFSSGRGWMEIGCLSFHINVIFSFLVEIYLSLDFPFVYHSLSLLYRKNDGEVED
ncbi:hypothetical protein AVEN_175217-1 [Araneus ventricosus]|uniref:Uncharacterized protein n=1 Tax=Araneus ventricosus TaxID=182803 RepID=A0A4Y2SKN3_ARAVE|nr:hypothetical protein AVEN_175217-1 [Araneus ventricosus]